MGLDAVVYCDCYEKGRTRRPPPQPELVYVDQNGQVSLEWDAVGADQNAFFDWLKDACDHGPMGELVSHRLGNLATIGTIRSLLADSGQDFSILLTNVVHNGAHAGDWLSSSDVEQLGAEIQRLSIVHADDELGESILRQFEQQMSELVAAAMRTQKPIAFTDQTSVPIGTYPFSFPDSKNDQLALPPNVDRKFRPPMRTKSSLPSGRLSLSGLRHENARRANWLEFRKKDDAPTLHSECLDRE